MRKASSNERRKIDSHYVREHRRCGTSIFFSACQRLGCFAILDPPKQDFRSKNLDFSSVKVYTSSPPKFSQPLPQLGWIVLKALAHVARTNVPSTSTLLVSSSAWSIERMPESGHGDTSLAPCFWFGLYREFARAHLVLTKFLTLAVLVGMRGGGVNVPSTWSVEHCWFLVTRGRSSACRNQGTAIPLWRSAFGPCCSASVSSLAVCLLALN